MQGQIGDPLQRPDDSRHPLGLVDFRQPHVDVQHMGPAFLLGDPLPQDVFHVVFPQGLLEARLARGIDPLPHDDRRAADGHRFGVGGNHRAPLAAHRRRGDPPAAADHGRQMGRRGAAAAAQQPGPSRRHRLHVRRESLGAYVEDRPSVFAAGQPRVGVDDNRQGGAGHQLREQALHLIRPQAAVEAQGVHSQPLEQGHGSRDIPAGEQLALVVEYHGGEDRQLRDLLGRQHRRFQLIGIAHGFDEQAVGPRPLPRRRHFGEQVVGRLEGQLSQRLQQLAGGADIHGHPYVVPSALASRLLRQAHSGGNHRLGPLTELQPVGPEGVGLEDLAARLRILPVDVPDNLRPGEVPFLRQHPLRQPRLLQHGAHGPVEKEQLFSQPLPYGLCLHRPSAPFCWCQKNPVKRQAPPEQLSFIKPAGTRTPRYRRPRISPCGRIPRPPSVPAGR